MVDQGGRARERIMGLWIRVYALYSQSWSTTWAHGPRLLVTSKEHITGQVCGGLEGAHAAMVFTVRPSSEPTVNIIFTSVRRKTCSERISFHHRFFNRCLIFILNQNKL